MITDSYLATTGRAVCPPGEPFRWSLVARTFRRGLLSLMASVVILWGMLGGVVTPTEAGLLAVAYAVVLGLLYRKRARFGPT